MICPNCGANNADQTKFCVACGARFEEQTPPPPPPPVYQQPQQNYQSQANYQQPPYQQPVPAVDPRTMPLTTGQFMIMDLLMMIPIVNLIILFVWGFSSTENENRKSWCKAKLIWMLIGIGITVILTIIFTIVGVSLFDSLSSY